MRPLANSTVDEFFGRRCPQKIVDGRTTTEHFATSECGSVRSHMKTCVAGLIPIPRVRAIVGVLLLDLHKARVNKEVSNLSLCTSQC